MDREWSEDAWHTNCSYWFENLRDDGDILSTSLTRCLENPDDTLLLEFDDGSSIAVPSVLGASFVCQIWELFDFESSCSIPGDASTEEGNNIVCELTGLLCTTPNPLGLLCQLTGLLCQIPPPIPTLPDECDIDPQDCNPYNNLDPFINQIPDGCDLDPSDCDPVNNVAAAVVFDDAWLHSAQPGCGVAGFTAQTALLQPVQAGTAFTATATTAPSISAPQTYSGSLDFQGRGYINYCPPTGTLLSGPLEVTFTATVTVATGTAVRTWQSGVPDGCDVDPSDCNPVPPLCEAVDCDPVPTKYEAPLCSLEAVLTPPAPGFRVSQDSLVNLQTCEVIDGPLVYTAIASDVPVASPLEADIPEMQGGSNPGLDVAGVDNVPVSDPMRCRTIIGHNEVKDNNIANFEINTIHHVQNWCYDAGIVQWYRSGGKKNGSYIAYREEPCQIGCGWQPENIFNVLAEGCAGCSYMRAHSHADFRYQGAFDPVGGSYYNHLNNWLRSNGDGTAKCNLFFEWRRKPLGEILPGLEFFTWHKDCSVEPYAREGG